MILNAFSYIALPEHATAEALLLANGRPKTLRHVQDVAEECARIAQRFDLDPELCRTAGLLHDVSAVIKPADMLLWAQENRMPLCEAELRHPFLLHQRLSGVVAWEYFAVRDENVLSAIKCHTTLRANASPYDMALFLADKLAWDQEGEPPYLAQVQLAMERSLEAGCLAYMTYIMENGRLLFPHTNWTLALEWLQAGARP